MKNTLALEKKKLNKYICLFGFVLKDHDCNKQYI